MPQREAARQAALLLASLTARRRKHLQMAVPEEPRTVLIVEDNESLREATANLLQREGYAVLLAANGKEALSHLHAGPPPSLIVLDMFMPVVDGWRFLQLLKQQATPLSVPILITTASTILSREGALALGCTGFVPKPIDPAELLEEIQRLLSL